MKGTYLAWVALCGYMASLGQACSPDIHAVTGATSSRVTQVSRIYLPTNGGQTIKAPVKMADVATLWMPLTPADVKMMNTARAGKRHSATGVDKTLLEAGDMAPWLPPYERQVMNDYIYRLTTTHPGITGNALTRAGVYLPEIQKTLAAYGIPQELAALPLVESAFEPEAISPAGAAGLWQLMPDTARRFGLRVPQSGATGRDERFDPYKATEAAAQYLRFLHDCFGDWHVAIAAYNCGEGAMKRQLAQTRATDLPALLAAHRQGYGGVMADETASFVPKYLAALAVMRESGTLGLSKGNLIQTGSQLHAPHTRHGAVTEHVPPVRTNEMHTVAPRVITQPSLYPVARGKHSATVPAMKRIP